MMIVPTQNSRPEPGPEAVVVDEHVPSKSPRARLDSYMQVVETYNAQSSTNTGGTSRGHNSARVPNAVQWGHQILCGGSVLIGKEILIGLGSLPRQDDGHSDIFSPQEVRLLLTPDGLRPSASTPDALANVS